jgi:glucose-1-phosphate thymidylyltransferase
MKKYVGIILAGGLASRLYPITKVIPKSLLPILDRPLIYFPLSVLLLSGIKDILIVSNELGVNQCEKILGRGEHLGINISYEVQLYPNGIAESFIIGEDFIGENSVCLILGDNIFIGHGLTKVLSKITNNPNKDNGIILGYKVKDPTRFGVIEIDKTGKPLSIEEKPKKPKSSWAIPGLYFYPNSVIEIAKSLKPSKRGELEITDVNKKYLERNLLQVELLGRGFFWEDVGVVDAFVETSLYLKLLEGHQRLKMGCIEEIVYNLGYIDKKQLLELAESMKNSDYGKYLFSLTEEEGAVNGI